MPKTSFTKKFLLAHILLGVFAILSIFSLAPSTQGQSGNASLYFGPASATYSVGNAISLRVYVSSPTLAMNAVEATINYPEDKLEVISLDKSGSIISLWVQEPSFSNGNGTVNLSAIVLNPGYQGSSGRIITLNMRAKAAGNARITFSSAAVLANDGAGTNILSGAGSADFVITSTSTQPPAEQPVQNQPTPAGQTPRAPVISSSTHPDQDKWFASNDPTFEWTLPTGINGVNVLANREPNTDPGTRSDGIIRNYTYPDVDEGVWYFHIKFRNAAGWGVTSHYKFQIDTEKPESFEIKRTESEGRFIFEASDKTSGIDHYEISFDGGTANTWVDDGSHTYQAPQLSAGSHTMLVKAVDKAGNFLEQNISFVSTQPPVVEKKFALPFAIPWKTLGLILAALLTLVLLYGLLKILGRIFRKIFLAVPVRRKDKDMEELRRAFNQLNQNIRGIVDYLDKVKLRKSLNRDEEHVLKSLNNALFARSNEKAIVIASFSNEGDRIVEGVFDGKNMMGFDGKEYSVPPNYASKSHLVQGDKLKLTITEDGSFVYKQIGPVERKRVFGELIRDGDEYVVKANNRPYKVLLAAVTYFKAEPGDEVTVLVPKEEETEWAAIEHVVKADHPEKVEKETKKKTVRKRQAQPGQLAKKKKTTKLKTAEA